eukprot:TRINITY_DN8552_c0_g2_i2.p1 TRINITY_DN8552_c0_g2~~TRINITY_DN8552_c0_g2_i2.p1  ORF type:complete len:1003 (-),score=217.45 TRINITY_DN8552_c0_g2_i2:142-3108(-)
MSLTDKTGMNPAAPIPAWVQCKLRVLRQSTGDHVDLTLREGSVLRLGRSRANDVVLDVDGTSQFHAELFLRTAGSEGGIGGLCIRDNSKNGTGVRPGPQSAAGAPDWSKSLLTGTEPPWEPCRRGTFRALDHGWQILAPMRSSRKGSNAPMDTAPPTFTVFVNDKVFAGEEAELDGEEWEPFEMNVDDRPIAQNSVTTLESEPAGGSEIPGRPAGGNENPRRVPGEPMPPPPPDLVGGAFEEPPPPPILRKALPAPAQETSVCLEPPPPPPPAEVPQELMDVHVKARLQWMGVTKKRKDSSARAVKKKRKPQTHANEQHLPEGAPAPPAQDMQTQSFFKAWGLPDPNSTVSKKEDLASESKVKKKRNEKKKHKKHKKHNSKASKSSGSGDREQQDAKCKCSSHSDASGKKREHKKRKQKRDSTSAEYKEKQHKKKKVKREIQEQSDEQHDIQKKHRQSIAQGSDEAGRDKSADDSDATQVSNAAKHEQGPLGPCTKDANWHDQGKAHIEPLVEHTESMQGDKSNGDELALACKRKVEVATKTEHVKESTKVENIADGKTFNVEESPTGSGVVATAPEAEVTKTVAEEKPDCSQQENHMAPAVNSLEKSVETCASIVEIQEHTTEENSGDQAGAVRNEYVDGGPKQNQEEVQLDAETGCQQESPGSYRTSKHEGHLHSIETCVEADAKRGENKPLADLSQTQAFYVDMLAKPSQNATGKNSVETGVEANEEEKGRKLEMRPARAQELNEDAPTDPAEEGARQTVVQTNLIENEQKPTIEVEKTQALDAATKLVEDVVVQAAVTGGEEVAVRVAQAGVEAKGQQNEISNAVGLTQTQELEEENVPTELAEDDTAEPTSPAGQVGVTSPATSPAEEITRAHPKRPKKHTTKLRKGKKRPSEMLKGKARKSKKMKVPDSENSDSSVHSDDSSEAVRKRQRQKIARKNQQKTQKQTGKRKRDAIAEAKASKQDADSDDTVIPDDFKELSDVED